MSLEKEFREFQSMTELSVPPTGISELILSKVSAELNPSIAHVFTKLSFIHLLTGIFTLSVCPQFGFRVFGTGMGLMHYFMNLGDHGCMLACGFVFLGTSVAVASTLMTRSEIRVLTSNRALGISALALMSFGFFLMVDAKVVMETAFAWFLGSVAGGYLALELRKIIDRNVFRYHLEKTR